MPSRAATVSYGCMETLRLSKRRTNPCQTVSLKPRRRRSHQSFPSDTLFEPYAMVIPAVMGSPMSSSTERPSNFWKDHQEWAH